MLIVMSVSQGLQQQLTPSSHQQFLQLPCQQHQRPSLMN
jgi:hypothetical protein